jgi:thiamine biosynthesis lipoprotein
MTMAYRVVLGRGLNAQESAQACLLIHKTYAEIDEHYNNWNPLSEISHINAVEAYTPVALSPQLSAFLKRVDHLVQVTEGRFDPTVAPLCQLWKKHLEEGRRPSDQEIQSLAPAIGWNKIHLEGEVLWKEHSLTALDLGGIAKGYCVDLLIERLSKAFSTGVYVEWGGEIRVAGPHPAQRPWRIALASPHQEEVVFSMHDQSVATSGDYLQFWDIDKVRYTHILHPKTLFPLICTEDSTSSATILTSLDCLWADAIATASLLFPTPEEAEAWLKSLTQEDPSLRYWLFQRGVKS